MAWQSRAASTFFLPVTTLVIITWLQQDRKLSVHGRGRDEERGRAARGGVGGRRSGSAAGAMGGARVVSGDGHARRQWPGRDAGMRGAARAVSTMWSGPEGRGVARDGDERPPRARPFEHRAQGPMGCVCVCVWSLARRGERAAAAGRSLGRSSARAGGLSPCEAAKLWETRIWQLAAHHRRLCVEGCGALHSP